MRNGVVRINPGADRGPEDVARSLIVIVPVARFLGADIPTSTVVLDPSAGPCLEGDGDMIRNTNLMGSATMIAVAATVTTTPVVMEAAVGLVGTMKMKTL